MCNCCDRSERNFCEMERDELYVFFLKFNIEVSLWFQLRRSVKSARSQ